jgi:uncharacterized membrane protein YeaQ/YmgE (transglycosylase-associated protein family)
MNILLWIIFGGVAGWVASLIVGTDERMGLIANIIVGIIGAFIGGWLSYSLGMDPDSDPERPTSLLSFVWAVIGAIILLIGLNLIL